MTLKVSQGHQNGAIWQAIYHIVLVVFSIVSLFRCFLDITTSTAYVIACVLEKSFSFDLIVLIIGYLYFPVCV